eukprot:8152982-Lingulodinium_polyedra.AAC.1
MWQTRAAPTTEAPARTAWAYRQEASHTQPPGAKKYRHGSAPASVLAALSAPPTPRPVGARGT